MRSLKRLYSDYIDSYPLSDRATFVYDGRSAFFYGIFTGLALPLVGVVGRKLGMSSSQLAILMSAQFVGLFANLWLGHLAKPGNAVAFMFWPGALSRASVVLVALAVSPSAFLAVMCFYYILSNLSGPAYSMLMRSNYSDANRARAMGHIRVMLQLVSALCAALAGACLDAFPEGYRVVFPVAAAAGFSCSFLFRKVRPRKRFFLEAERRPRESFKASLSVLAEDKRFLAYMAITFAAGFPDKLLLSLEPIRLVDELGAGYGAAGLVLGTVPLAAAVLGYFLCARFTAKFDPIILLVATVALASSRFLGFALASVPAHLVPGAFLNGIANAGWDLLPLFAILLFSGEARVALYMGLYNTLIGLRGLAGPALGTWLYEGLGMRIRDIYWIAFGVEVASALALLAFWAYSRRAGFFRASRASSRYPTSRR